VQGGGCGTVGVAGLIQGGGFGTYSKNFGTAAASVLQAEVVTSDGAVRIANACTHPDLFWALKGGGGGTFGVGLKPTKERLPQGPDFVFLQSLELQTDLEPVGAPQRGYFAPVRIKQVHGVEIAALARRRQLHHLEHRPTIRCAAPQPTYRKAALRRP